MKRRAFIGLIGASALSMPFIFNGSGLGSSSRNNRIAATTKKIPMRLKLPADVQDICAHLGTKSRRVHLLGGTAIAAAAGVESPFVNLLIDTPKFAELKQSLFEFGVSPISTAELPGNFARFTYQDKSYNLLNMDFDAYTLLSVAGQDNGLILFAHNFLIYNVKDGSMLDPYGALSTRSADGKSYLIKPIQQPKTLLSGFEHCLAATFDQALLGLKPSHEYVAIEDRLLYSTPTAEDSKEIMAKMLDYSSDMLEVGGMSTLSKFLVSHVCVTAAKIDAEIDLVKVDANLRKLQKQGVDVSGREFMTIVHDELKKKTSGKGAARGLPEYLAASRDQFRRTQVLKDAMEETRTA
jgi:hypothetical protein